MKNQIIIIGGGTSIQEGISLGLWEQLKDKFTLGLNYNYNHFNSSCLVWVDTEFARDNYKDLKNLPLTIGKHDDLSEGLHLSNTLLLKSSGRYWGEQCIKKGVYSSQLCGIFSLNLAVWMAKRLPIWQEGVKEIYLLGYDFTRRTPEQLEKAVKTNTHYYNNIIHRGMGYTEFYEHYNPDELFHPFVIEKYKGIDIYNVSLNSLITLFPKLSYPEFFEKLDSHYCQNCIRYTTRLTYEKENK